MQDATYTWNTNLQRRSADGLDGGGSRHLTWTHLYFHSCRPAFSHCLFRGNSDILCDCPAGAFFSVPKKPVGFYQECCFEWLELKALSCNHEISHPIIHEASNITIYILPF